MLYSLLYDLLRLLIEILIVRGRGDAQLRAEVLALRHRLGVLERQVGRPRWQANDRLLLAAISRALPGRARRIRVIDLEAFVERLRKEHNDVPDSWL